MHRTFHQLAGFVSPSGALQLEGFVGNLTHGHGGESLQHAHVDGLAVDLVLGSAREMQHVQAFQDFIGFTAPGHAHVHVEVGWGRGDKQAQEKSYGAVTWQVRKVDIQQVADLLRAPLAEQFHLGAGGDLHLDARVFERDRSQVAEFLQQEFGDTAVIVNVIEVAAAAVGDVLHQVFIEAQPDTEGGGGDAALEDLGGMFAQFGWVGDALVGLSITEQQGAVDLGGSLAVSHALAAGQPSIAQVGGTAGTDVFYVQFEFAAGERVH